jgi:lipid A 4'-phosphatase
MQRPLYLWILPLLILALIAPWTAAWDLAISHYFYNEHLASWSSHSYFTFMYRFGYLPAIVTALASLTFLIYSYFRARWQALRAPAWILLLSLVIGSGILVNTVLKPHWGRPRPRQIEEFGGKFSFRAFYEKPFSKCENQGSCHSFPSGHVSTGFYFLAFFIIGKRFRNRSILIYGSAFCLFLTLSLALSRIAQGGHFFTDILCAGIVMWISILAVEELVDYWQRKGHL